MQLGNPEEKYLLPRFQEIMVQSNLFMSIKRGH